MVGRCMAVCRVRSLARFGLRRGARLRMGRLAGRRSARAGQVDYERPPIDYLHAAVHDPIAQLQERLDRGDVQLAAFAENAGYLASVLQALEVPVSSQVLVFSKTSFQHGEDFAAPSARAFTSTTDVYVGWVPARRRDRDRGGRSAARDHLLHAAPGACRTSAIRPPDAQLPRVPRLVPHGRRAGTRSSGRSSRIGPASRC